MAKPNLIERFAVGLGHVATAQQGKRGPVARLIKRTAMPLGGAAFVANRVLHWREPYGKWMEVRIPDDMPGKEIIPSYYLIPFHGQVNGYLSELSARSYDAGVGFVFAGKDNEMRAQLMRRLEGSPRRILDIGSGTGTSTFHLCRTFPEAEVIGVDLSPYYVDHANDRAKRKGLNARFIHAKGEDLPFDDESFDLVASTFVFHEVPVPFTKRIVAEAFRVLRPGCQLGICDAAQLVDNLGADFFQRSLYEPYFKKYARMDWKRVVEDAGFEDARLKPTRTYGVHMSKTIVCRKPEAAAKAA